jgi:hypothetical protein
MGQKIHPQGLRVGLTRKWNSNWFATGAEWKNLFFYQKEVENFFKALFYFYPYTKISRQKRVLLFDVKLFKYNLNKIFLFVFFYKFRTTRRKEVRAITASTTQTLQILKKKTSDNFTKMTTLALNKKAYFLKTKIRT